MAVEDWIETEPEARERILELLAENERLKAQVVLFTELQRASNQDIERLRAENKSLKENELYRELHD